MGLMLEKAREKVEKETREENGMRPGEKERQCEGNGNLKKARRLEGWQVEEWTLEEGELKNRYRESIII